MPKPIPRWMSAAAIPRTSWRCSPAWPSAPRRIWRNMTVEGISTSPPTTSALPREFGFRIKLLGVARRSRRHGIDQNVHPAMVRARTPLANVDGAANGVVVDAGEAGRFSSPAAARARRPPPRRGRRYCRDRARRPSSPVFGRPAAGLAKLAPADSRRGALGLVSALRGAGCARRAGRDRRPSVAMPVFPSKA